MSVPFIRRPGRFGPFLVRLDEYARAAAEFRVVERSDPGRFEAERASDHAEPRYNTDGGACRMGGRKRHAHRLRPTGTATS